MAKTLTILSVDAAKPRDDRYEVSDGGGALRLVIQPSGAKSWAVRYRIGSRTRKHTLGSYPALGLIRPAEGHAGFPRPFSNNPP